MLLFACVFILQACESRHMAPEERHSKLTTVSTTAKLLVELGIHSFHFPSIFGKSLQKRLENFQLNGCDDEKLEAQMGNAWPETPNLWADYHTSVNGETWYQDAFGGSEVLFGELLSIPNLNWYDALQ